MAHIKRQIERERKSSQRELWVWRILLLISELSTAGFGVYVGTHAEELAQSGMLDTLYILVGADFSVAVVLLAILLIRQKKFNS